MIAPSVARIAGWWAALLLLAGACLWSTADRLAGQGLLVRAPTPLLTGGQALRVPSATELRALRRVLRARKQELPRLSAVPAVGGVFCFSIGIAVRWFFYCCLTAWMSSM